jgi:hypothetical protein
MASTAADVLIESLQDWDVDTIFGLPGDGINGLPGAINFPLGSSCGTRNHSPHNSTSAIHGPSCYTFTSMAGLNSLSA